MSQYRPAESGSGLENWKQSQAKVALNAVWDKAMLLARTVPGEPLLSEQISTCIESVGAPFRPAFSQT